MSGAMMRRREGNLPASVTRLVWRRRETAEIHQLPELIQSQTAMDWSFQLCSEHERLLWTRLAVFAGGFDLDAFGAVCTGGDLTREHVLEALLGLMDKPIVTQEERGGGQRLS